MGNACPNRNRSLRATVTKTNIKYENGVVKIPMWIQMKVDNQNAMAFSQQVLEATATEQPAAQAEEAIPEE